MTGLEVVLAGFCFLVASIFTFFTIVYLKEYKREEKSIEEYVKLRKEQIKAEKDLIPLLYSQQPIPKKKKASSQSTASGEEYPSIPKNKKDIN